MRVFPLFLVFTLANISQGQTVVSVQDGPWTDPATWDCNCVPDFSNIVQVLHSLTVDGNVVFGQQNIEVTENGEITMFDIGTVAFVGGTFINEGHLLFMGQITVTGQFINAGVAEFIGELTNDGDMINGAGALIQVEGNFSNFQQLGGAGAMCVTDSTLNDGAINGTIDFCDWTPTTAVPPIIDVNNGTVEGTVTFCTNSPCALGVADDAMLANVTVRPDADALEISGFPDGGAQIDLIDATGRLLVRTRTERRTLRLALPMTAMGLCTVIVRADQGKRVFRVLLSR